MNVGTKSLDGDAPNGEPRVSVVVYKVGGSLLDLPDLPRRLQQIVPAGVRPLLVVGGGPAADLVRQWDRLHQLGQERAHWLALRSMQLGEALLADLVPEAARVSSYAEVDAVWQDGGWPILSALDFIRAEEPAADLSLPHAWDATSDSVAAWVAALWPAGRLVLLKSVPLPGTDDGNPNRVVPATENPQSAIRNPQSPPLDSHFAQIARRLPRVEWVNLRDAAPAARRLTLPLPASPLESGAPPLH